MWKKIRYIYRSDFEAHAQRLNTCKCVNPVGGSVGVKQADRESDHSPPSSVEFRNVWRPTRSPHLPSCISHGRIYPRFQHEVQGMSGKYPAILNISRTGRVALM